MSNENVMQAFMRATDGWLCDGYALDIRYIAALDGHAATICNASIFLNPLPPQLDHTLRIDTARMAVGQVQKPHVRKSDLQRILTRAAAGEIEVPGHALRLVIDKEVEYQSEMAQRDRWFSQLHLQAMGVPRALPSPIDLASTDHALRRSNPPFDGLADVAAWLELEAPGAATTRPSIGIRVSPPVDLIFADCSLADGQLTLTLNAHPKFDIGRLGLAVRAVPGPTLGSRRQIAGAIKWKRVRNGRRPGIARVILDQADNALVMLLIEDSTVRRQWFIDPAKARNNRLLAVQHFDRDLRMIKQAVLELPDSSKFESGIAALLFLLGFTPSVQIENDAPDLILTTPGGKLAIVECTTRIADFAAKIGKLVDRRGALSRNLSASGHPAQVAAIMVCRLPRNQIAAQVDEIRAHNIILVAGEDISAGFDRVRLPTDPDAMLDAAMGPRTSR